MDDNICLMSESTECPACHESGICPVCEGKGILNPNAGFIKDNICPACNGLRICINCRGLKRIVMVR